MIRFFHERQKQPESILQLPGTASAEVNRTGCRQTYGFHENSVSDAERRYITNTSLRKQDPACGGEKMEFLAWLYKEWIAAFVDQCSACINGNGSYGPEIQNDAEEVSYMADYCFDEHNRITEVHYDPVFIRHGEWIAERSKGGTRIRMDDPDPSA